MSDPYPTHLPIEIDRPALQRYLRAQWFLAWTGFLCVFGNLFVLHRLDRAVAGEFASFSERVSFVFKTFAFGTALGFTTGVFLYLLLSHWLAARIARSLEVTVEGPFLRIRQHGTSVTDRKLHFRSIVDYTATQGSLMRFFGIYVLQMTTIAGGPSSNVTIPGVKDCLKVRDTLSEIDRLREN